MQLYGFVNHDEFVERHFEHLQRLRGRLEQTRDIIERGVGAYVISQRLLDNLARQSGKADRRVDE